MKIKETQLAFNFGKTEQKDMVGESARLKNGNANKLNPHDRAVHDWYRFVFNNILKRLALDILHDQVCPVI